MIKIIFIFLVTFNLIYAESLNNISIFANQICDEIKPKGFINRSEIKTNISGKISPLSKILGVKIKADGTYQINDIKFEGLPYQSIPEQMKDSRECKKEIVFLLLEERSFINKTKNKSQYYYLEDNQYGSVHLFEKPEIISNPKEICEVEAKTKVKKIEEKKISAFSTWVNIKVLEGECINKTGWTGKGHLHRQ